MRYLLIALALLTTMMSNAQETNTTEKANSKKIAHFTNNFIANLKNRQANARRNKKLEHGFLLCMRLCGYDFLKNECDNLVKIAHIFS